MYRLFKSDVGRGITGIVVSIVMVLAVLFPIFFMEVISRFFSLG
jgi:hypothetical protein